MINTRRVPAMSLLRRQELTCMADSLPGHSASAPMYHFT